MLKPLADRVVAQKIEQKTQTASGLYLTPKSQEEPTGAKVVAIGPDVKSVKKGDQIIFKEYSSTEVKIDKDEYLIIKEEDVLAILDGGKK